MTQRNLNYSANYSEFTGTSFTIHGSIFIPFSGDNAIIKP